MGLRCFGCLTRVSDVAVPLVMKLQYGHRKPSRPDRGHRVQWMPRTPPPAALATLTLLQRASPGPGTGVEGSTGAGGTTDSVCSVWATESASLAGSEHFAIARNVVERFCIRGVSRQAVYKCFVCICIQSRRHRDTRLRDAGEVPQDDGGILFTIKSERWARRGAGQL